MRIKCTKCQTNYVVNGQLIGFTGREVKCKKCDHIWFQKSPYDDELKKIIEIVVESIGQPNEPIPEDRVPVPIAKRSYFFLFPVSVILLTLILSLAVYSKDIINMFPASRIIYKIASIVNDNTAYIDDLKLFIEEYDVIRVLGDIKTQEPYIRNLKGVHISYMDINKKQLTEKFIPIVTTEKKKQIPFDFRLDMISNAVEYVKIDLNVHNDLEILMR